jgi:phosphatidylglycerophosphatase A
MHRAAGRTPAHWFLYLYGTFLGTGFAPVAPATVASFVLALLWWVASPVSLPLQIALLVVVIVSGVPVAGWLSRRHGPDPSLAVIDEVAGMLVTYLGVSTGLAGWLAGFFWFRVFDVLKPFPVRRLESLPGGWGIMADDLLAGVYAAVLLRLTLRVTGW